MDEVTVQQLLGELEFGSAEKREAAMTQLMNLPFSYAALLEKERKSTDNKDKAKRLSKILASVLSSFDIEQNALLGKSTAGRLLYVDRSDRSYVVLPGKEALLVLGAKISKRITIPDESFTIDYESKEGALYAHDRKYYYRLDPSKKSPLSRLFRQEERGMSGQIFHVTNDGKVGVSRKTPGISMPWVDYWVDTKKKSSLPPMPGHVIAAGMSCRGFHMPFGHLAATGPGETFWFVKLSGTGDEPNGAVYRVQNGQIGAMGEGTMRLSGTNLIWPLSDDRAIVISDTSSIVKFGATMIAGTQKKGYARLKDLVEAEWKTLLKYLPEAGGFWDGVYYWSHHTMLIRVGDGLAMQEYYHTVRPGLGSGTFAASGIFRKGRWAEFVQEGLRNRKQPMIFGGWIGVNKNDGTIIGFGPKYKRIIARGIDSRAPRETVLASKDKEWAHSWMRAQGRPRFAGHLVLNPAAADRRLAIKASGEKLTPSDYTGYRFLRGGKWVDVPFSLFRGEAYIINGQLFHFMMGQVKILLPSGKVQIVETAGSWSATKISRESDDAVWINDVVSMRRMQAVRDEKIGVITSYKQTHHFSLAKLGFFVTGPWFSGGYGYYFADDTLHMFSLDELKTTQKSKPK